MRNSSTVKTSADECLPDVVASLGTPALGAALFGWLRDSLRVDEFFVFERPANLAESPSSILSSGRHPFAGERTGAYCDHFHRMDPINPMLVGGDTAAGEMRVATSQIADRNYRAVCYERPNFSEKVSLWRRETSHWIVASIFRSADVGPFGVEEMDAIGRCGRLLFPLIAKHRALSSIYDSGAVHKEALIERAAKRFAMLSAALTPRQLAVCSRTAVGMTAYGIALELGIKTSSVVTHRRRAYERLGISGGHELTRLLLR